MHSAAVDEKKNGSQEMKEYVAGYVTNVEDLSEDQIRLYYVICHQEVENIRLLLKNQPQLINTEFKENFESGFIKQSLLTLLIRLLNWKNVSPEKFSEISSIILDAAPACSLVCNINNTDYTCLFLLMDQISNRTTNEDIKARLIEFTNKLLARKMVTIAQVQFVSDELLKFKGLKDYDITICIELLEKYKLTIAPPVSVSSASRTISASPAPIDSTAEVSGVTTSIIEHADEKKEEYVLPPDRNESKLTDDQKAFRQALFKFDSPAVIALLDKDPQLAHFVSYGTNVAGGLHLESALTFVISEFCNRWNTNNKKELENFLEIVKSILTAKNGYSTFCSFPDTIMGDSVPDSYIGNTTLHQLMYYINFANDPMSRQVCKKVAEMILLTKTLTTEQILSVKKQLEVYIRHLTPYESTWSINLLNDYLRVISPAVAPPTAAAPVIGDVVASGVASPSPVALPMSPPNSSTALISVRTSTMLPSSDRMRAATPPEASPPEKKEPLVAAEAAVSLPLTTAVLSAQSRQPYKRFDPADSYISKSNIKVIEAALNKDEKQTPWKVEDNTEKRSQGFQDVYKDGERKCRLYDYHITTEDKQVETFKQILLAHYAVYKPGASTKIPKITTTYPDLWNEAFEQVKVQLKKEGIQAEPQIKIIPVSKIDLSKFNLAGPAQALPEPTPSLGLTR